MTSGEAVPQLEDDALLSFLPLSRSDLDSTLLSVQIRNKQIDHICNSTYRHGQEEQEAAVEVLPDLIQVPGSLPSFDTKQIRYSDQ